MSFLTCHSYIEVKLKPNVSYNAVKTFRLQYSETLFFVADVAYFKKN